ncbi:uncharacterized protein [Apostichopus japonicus]|uniref:uncharacterized protein isoform X3 n=1 Tax=Stichopus japonicus TaxID=307972 RepID=UPI003AB626F9
MCSKTLLATVIISFSSVFGDANEQRCHDDATSSELWFDTGTDLCCKGKVVNHLDHRYGCHNDVMYDRTKSSPCGEVLLDVDSDMKCSQSGRPYNSSTDMECMGNVFPKADGDACCLDQSYDSSSEFCCKTNNGTLPLSAEECCREITNDADQPRGLHCCAGSPYSEDTHLCCFNELYAQEESMVCGQHPSIQPYDTRTHIEIRSSNGHWNLQPIEDGKTEICGSSAINPFYSVCCWWETFNTLCQEVGSASGAFCGSLPYNRETTSCCGGKLNPGIPEIPGITECAGTTAFLNSQKRLCQGKLHTITETSRTQCCGTELFDDQTELCCSDQIQRKTSPAMECCDTLVHDPTVQTCYVYTREDWSRAVKVLDIKVGSDRLCAGLVLEANEFCKKKIFGPDTIIKGRDGDNAICGTQAFNTEEFFCDRRDNLIPRNPNDGLCFTEYGNQLFDLSRQICCYGNLYDLKSACGGERQCCGGDVFLEDFQSCNPSTNNVVDIPTAVSDSCHGNMFDTRTHVCDDENLMVVSKEEFAENQSVCYFKDGGYSRYDRDEHICCNGQLWCVGGIQDPSCCGNFMFDNASNDHVCCEGVLHVTGGLPKECQGRIAYSQDQMVCNGVLFNKTEGSCCGSGVFDPDTELCCENVKITKSVDGETCCGTASYDINDPSKTCCKSKTLHDSIPGHRCCGTTLMGPEMGTCLNDEFVLGREHLNATCDSSVSDQPGGTCCSGLLYVGNGSCDGLQFTNIRDDPRWCGVRLLDADEVCCSGVIFSSSTHVCRDNVLLPTCGGVTYEASTHECCNQKVIDKSRKICCMDKPRKITNGENSCCKRSAYNSETSICCGGTVRDLEDGTLDLDECCPDPGQTFSLSHGGCQDVETTTSTSDRCSICPEEKKTKSMIQQAACSSTFQVYVKPIATNSSSGEVTVRVSKLPKFCPACDQKLLTKKSLKKITTLVLPCSSCSLILNRKYLLLDSVTPEEGGRVVVVSEGAMLLQRRASKLVMGTYTGETCTG